MGEAIPFRYISGLPQRAQWELERDFLALQTQIGAAKQRNRYFIAPVDASADEIAQADIVLDGTTDAAVLNALTSGLTSTHPDGMDIEFATGTITLSSTWTISHGIRIRGTMRQISGGINYTFTTIRGTGASSNFLSGPTDPVLIDCSDAPGFECEWITFVMTGITGATNKDVFFNGSTIALRQRFAFLVLDSSISNMFLGSHSQTITNYVIEHIYPAATPGLIDPSNSPTGLSDGVIFDAIGLQVNQTFVFSSLLLWTSPTSSAEINSNKILPGASNSVTNSQLAQMPANTIKGNNTGGTANAADLTTAQVKTMIISPGLAVAEGSNKKQGVATLSGGTVTVSNTSVTASSRIFLTVQSLGTVVVPTAIAVTATSVGASFTITSANAADTSVVAWEIFEPG